MKYHTLNLETLKPGDVLTHAQLTELYTANTSSMSNPPEEGLFLLGLREHIETESLRSGNPLFIRQKNKDWHFIQGDELSQYLAHRFNTLINQAEKKSILGEYVDASGMSPEEILAHKKRLRDMQEQTVAIECTRHKLALNAGNRIAYNQLVRPRIKFDD